MNYYIFIYTLSITLSLICGILVFYRHRNSSGLFFFLFTFFVSIWTFLYFLFFSGINNVSLLLFLSRLNFAIGLGATFSLSLFIFFFETKYHTIWSNKILGIIVFYCIILTLYIPTDLIIAGLSYSTHDDVYREIPGKLYPLHIMLHMLAVTLFGWFSFLQSKKQTHLNKIRLKRILLSTALLLISCLLLQLILPIFGIWILEKEIVFFFTFFMVYIFYILRRYYFSSIGYGIGKIIVALTSIGMTIFCLNGIKFIYTLLHGYEQSYWISHDTYSIIDVTITIIVFFGIHHVLQNKLLGMTKKIDIKREIHQGEKKIATLTNSIDMEKYLKIEMKKIFKTEFCTLCIFPYSPTKNAIQTYFEKNLTDKIFINDVVFIEERKNKFDKYQILEELPKETFLALPLFNTEGEDNIGIFVLGQKSFGDFYTIDEIDILREFTSFLELHMKYIKTYETIQDLSINLDKKVDEKTIEYNNLLNKQKEFISIISHEIKAPISNAIFQADSIMDDMDNANITPENIKKEFMILSGELVKTGELVSRLFSMQYFDTRNVSLFKEWVQISELLIGELGVYSHMHEDIRFINLIDKNIGFIECDKLQLHQVFTNLFQNAIKFLDKKESVVLIECYKKWGYLHICIEDNGRGFQGIDIENLFDQYTTGNSQSIGLGLGLYLCKKIIEMHNGTITASIGERLGGAQFSIKIPL